MRYQKCGSGLVAALLLAACGAAPTGTASLPATEGVTPPTASEIPESAPETAAGSSPPASPSATATPALGQLTVPAFATVTADNLLVREEPGLGSQPVLDYSACIGHSTSCERPFILGTERGWIWVYLLDGPVAADSYQWYLAATEMNTEEHASTYPEAIGWVASGDGTDAWLVPDDRPCPAQPIALADVTNLAMTKLEMLHCLRGQQLTLRGWYPALPPGEAEPTVSQEECRSRDHWLLCYSIFDVLRAEEAGWAGPADYLDFVVDPASDAVIPERSQWITVTGAFDHPAAADCGDLHAVIICRSQFVVTSITAG